MAFLIPKSELLEWWESWIWTGGFGKRQYEIVIYADSTVEMALRSPLPGMQEQLYRFLGMHLPVTPTHGILHLTTLEKQPPLKDVSHPGIEVDLSDFENMLRFEYFRVDKPRTTSIPMMP